MNVPLLDKDYSYSYVQKSDLLKIVQELSELGNTLSGSGQTSVILSQKGGLMRLKGLGKHIWQGVDVQGYIDHLRDEWEK